jgi:hypothetical protein
MLGKSKKNKKKYKKGLDKKPLVCYNKDTKREGQTPRVKEIRQ